MSNYCYEAVKQKLAEELISFRILNMCLNYCEEMIFWSGLKDHLKGGILALKLSTVPVKKTN